MDALTNGLGPKDVLTLLATNIVAFLLLLWILRKYAWGPLLESIDSRRNKIRSDYDAAAAKVEEAEQFRYDYEVKLAEIRELEREKVQLAVKKGEGLAATIEIEARAKAGYIVEKAEAESEREFAEARISLHRDVVSLALGAAEKLVHEKLDDAKHRELIEKYITDLGSSRA